MAPQSAETLTKLPPIPKEFGDDGGKFYKYYDELADELDDDMVASLKSQLDGILIFLSADPAEDTNALLFQIMLGNNSTIRTPSDLPSASFTPPAGAYLINVLFSMSLTLAILGSFLAVLGQQWLVYYRKRGGGGAESQRWEQLRRYLGAKRWRLELVLDDVLPSLLQIALVIFCIAFILYLGTLSDSLCYTIAAPLCGAGAIIVLTAMCAAWDHWCPFKSPLSHLFQYILQGLAEVLGRVVGIPGSYTAVTLRWLRYRSRGGEDQLKNWMSGVVDEARTISEWLKARCLRTADASDYLKVVALKRVLCTSEDPIALIHSATAVQSISQSQLLTHILNDIEIRSRIEALDTISFSSVMFHGTEKVTMQNTAIARSLFHIALMVGSAEDFLHSDDRSLLKSQTDDQAYASQALEKLDDKFASFFPMKIFSVDTECPECSHCITMNYCMSLVSMITRIGEEGPELVEIEPEHLARGKGVIGASRSVGIIWIEAWTIIMSKEWDQLFGGKGKRDLTPNTEECTWKLEKFREFLRLYQNMDEAKFVQIIYDAIATLTVEWRGRPGHEIYVRLLQQDLLLRSESGSFSRNLGQTLSGLAILLRSIESRIRDEAISNDERDSQREHRRICTQAWIKYINKAYNVDQKDYRSEEDCLIAIGPLWLHCVGASPALQEYLGFMRDVVKADPGNADNAHMITMVIQLYDRLGDPEESFQRCKGVAEQLFQDWLDEGTMHKYRQFYSVLAEAVGELASAIPVVASSALLGEGPKTPLEKGRFNTQIKSFDKRVSLEWWGN
ncbi:hypothetical protein FS837_002951 [Tulasnella sp. UAMH 9824]|nr:hypothetical protein FS837_002951 [Tulasnella sp. UAMH 9824]